MNKRTLSILGLGLLLGFASCKKSEVEVPAPSASEQSTVATAWKTVSSWQSSKEDKFTTFSGAIQDNSITADVVENGLVLLFMKNGSGATGLPFQAKGGQDIYWNYQVSENQILINADAYTGEVSNQAAFRYFVISEQKLKDLESQGTSRIGLMTLTYENAATLLK